MIKDKLYGLIGHPLSHSFSKKYFTNKFEKESIIDCEYQLFPIENIEQLPELIKNNPQLKGFNVTIPYKESIIPFLDELDETAKVVGAVNCVKVISNKDKLIGYNTDTYGFKQSIKPFLESRHERALIFGTGGASKAVAYVLKQIGIDCFFVTRNKNKSEVSTSELFDYSDLNKAVFDSFKLIINTTPVGMFPDLNSSLLIPYHSITPSHLLYDIIYNPTETEFLKQGKKQGATTINGLSMFYQQAEESWKTWNK